MIYCIQLGPNADDIMWQEVQIKIADVKFGAKDAKEKNKVHVSFNLHMYTSTILKHTINREYFIVKMLSDSLANTKIKRTKIHAQ